MDHVFVIGRDADASVAKRKTLVSEQTAHGDLLEVDCEENCMNRGKPFLMFQRMYQLVRAPVRRASGNFAVMICFHQLATHRTTRSSVCEDFQRPLTACSPFVVRPSTSGGCGVTMHY